MSENQAAKEALLRRLSPLAGLKGANLSSLARKITISELGAGRMLFRTGDTDRRTIWLVSGTLELREGERTIGMLRGGTAETRNPLSPTLPRKVTARSVDPIRFLSIESDLLDTLITWDQTGIYEVGDITAPFKTDEAADWMTILLQTRVFQRIPPANIQSIFLRMRRVPFHAGEVVIQQGANGDCFYAIVSGKCSVTRETPLNAKGIPLAELGPGDAFGEEALISEAKRSATVRMLSQGVLMRLDKKDFVELIQEPLLPWIEFAEAHKIVELGGRWLDVRMPSEFQNMAIEGAINIPLCFLRVKLATLDATTPYVVCCDTGGRSSAAAYLLLERGFNSHVLRGGLARADAALRRAVLPL
jgi:rhodanese-related sulfurtransferase